MLALGIFGSILGVLFLIFFRQMGAGIAASYASLLGSWSVTSPIGRFLSSTAVWRGGSILIGAVFLMFGIGSFRDLLG